MKQKKNFFSWNQSVLWVKTIKVTKTLLILMMMSMVSLASGGYLDSNTNSKSVSQQQKSVSGTVSDDTGQPLPGVTVIIKGTTNGTVTNIDGNYSIPNISEEAILVYSFVGMQSKEIAVGTQTTIDVTMTVDAIGLEEVVAIGYGTKRKSDITSAISVVDVENLKDRPSSNASRMLQGQAAGVVVKQTSGRPGEEMNVVIRGVGSLGAGSSPLYVVDGFAVGTSVGQDLNPNDIESISILKDAASTAIYGARGSNGVVLIKTKNAKKGEVSLTAIASYGFQNLPDSRRIEMMNGVEFATFLKDRFMDKIRYFEGREPALEEVPEGLRYPEQTAYSTNWLDEVLNDNAPVQNYNLTLSSGTGKIKSLVSASYLNQEGALKYTGFERFNVRANVLGEFNEHITMGLNLVGSRTEESYTNIRNRNDAAGKALWADPRFPVYNEDGTFNPYIGGEDGTFGTANPVMELKEHKRERFTNTFKTNGFVEMSFLKDFKFKSSFNASLSNERMNDFRPSTLAGTPWNKPPAQNAVLNEGYNEFINIAADQLLSYAKVVEDHSFNALIGYSAQEFTARGIAGNAVKFPNDQIRFLQEGETTSVSSTESSWSMLAYFARLDYDYQNKYLVSASYRREGSSRFGENSKWGNFPAVSLGWRVSQESFMEDVSWINDLKLRGSYGITGNNAIGEYKNSASLAPAGYIMGNQYAPGVVLNSFANKNIGWEESNQLDIGLDLSLLDNKMIFTAEVYKKITNNMLLPVSIPVITGFTSTFTNVGKVQNKGLELALDYKTKVTNDFSVHGNFNISFNRNKVLEINEDVNELWSGGFYNQRYRSVIGRPVSMFTGFKVLGMFQTDEEIANSPAQDGAVPGVYKYFDGNGNGIIDYSNDDMVEIGNPHPAFVWALTLGADYKRFDLNILFSGMQNYDMSRQIEKTTLNMDGVFNLLQAASTDRFRSAEQPGNGVIPTSNTWKWERESNSRYIMDASHMWVKTVTLGYTLPKNSGVLKETRFYINADNLFLITKYPGSNPETSDAGDLQPNRDDEAYPVPRTISIGANIKF
nr:TonB-dependent receptor [uncultured Draconibacterium sp.]